MSSNAAGAGAREIPAQSGFRTALRYTGIPETWIRRPNLPSRNWLIFLSVTGTTFGLYAYDRRKCKQIRQAYIDRVKHLSEQPLQSWELPRKVTVYGSKWPGDDDHNRCLQYFRKYVKPILVAAAVDYSVINGKRHGDLTNLVSEQIKTRRRREMGLESMPRSIMPLTTQLTPEQRFQYELKGGSIIIGRNTMKEYMEGLRRGWTESPEKVDREESLSHELDSDGRFNEPDAPEPAQALEGEPIPTRSRLMPSSSLPVFAPLKLDNTSSQSKYQTPKSNVAHTPPDKLPPQPPLLLVPFTNYIGLKQIPLMIYGFFNERAKVQSGAEAAFKLVMDRRRPINGPSTSQPHLLSDPAASATPNADSDLDFDRQAEWYYKKSTQYLPAETDKTREAYYKSLSGKLEIARALARGIREPTKDEVNHPPPTEVELRAERMQKELKWRGDVSGWEIIRPEKDVAWDERFRDALTVFVAPQEGSSETQ